MRETAGRALNPLTSAKSLNSLALGSIDPQMRWPHGEGGGARSRVRRFRGLDLDPAYVDVAIERWVAMTGGRPELAERRKAA